MIVDLDGGALIAKTWPDPADVPQVKLIDLENYFSGPPVRTKVVDIPLADGAFNPGRSFRGAKRMNLIGMTYGVSYDHAEELSWEAIAALSPRGYPMTMTVTTERGPRTMRVWLDTGMPQVIPWTPTTARFKIPLVAPDGRKYGPVQTDTVGPSGSSSDGLIFPLFDSGYLDFGAFSPSGVFYLTNNGKAETWPSFKVRGTIATGFQILSSGRTLQYDAGVATGTEVTLSPYIGGRATIAGADVTTRLKVIPEWPSIKPGETRQFVFNPLGAADSNAQLTWTFSEAWW